MHLSSISCHRPSQARPCTLTLYAQDALGGSEQLRSQLAAAEAAAAKAEAELGEARARVDALEAQVSALEQQLEGMDEAKRKLEVCLTCTHCTQLVWLPSTQP